MATARNHGGGRPKTDWTGIRVGVLLAIEPGVAPVQYSYSAKQTWWVCSCNCGREVTVSSQRLKNGAKRCDHVAKR